MVRFTGPALSQGLQTEREGVRTMRRRRRVGGGAPGDDVDAGLGALGDDVGAALRVLGADELRALVHEMLLDLDDRARSRMAGSIIGWASREDPGWSPGAVDPEEVAEAVSFAEAAARDGFADPTEVDERLRRGNAAFLGKDYVAAHRIFGALLAPITGGDIDLGQDEMVEEVLGVDTSECAIRYVVAAYMIADPARRADMVREAIGQMQGVRYFIEPTREMERAANESLPGFGDFLVQWRALIEREAAGERRSDGDREADRWLREVVGRLEGADGLARLARRTRRGNDLRAWCESLVAAADWQGALAAFEEAARIVTEPEHVRAQFLDGAALAAQETGEKDLSPWFERAWRADATMARLCRWLGAARTAPSMHERVREALEACPRAAWRQRAFLCVLQGDVGQAAGLLAEAPGLGWSNEEHPGHLIFPLFQTLLGGSHTALDAATLWGRGEGIDAIDPLLTDSDDGPRLATPHIEEILRRAGVEPASNAGTREILIAAMRDAAGRRVAGVTGAKRRAHYGHAASLAAACVACDGSPETVRWLMALREAYRRFPALRAEFEHRLGRT